MKIEKFTWNSVVHWESTGGSKLGTKRYFKFRWASRKLKLRRVWRCITDLLVYWSSRFNTGL